MQNHNAAELNVEEAAMLEQIKRAGRYINFKRLDVPTLEVATQLKEKGWLLECMTERNVSDPDLIYAVQDEFSSPRL